LLLLASSSVWAACSAAAPASAPPVSRPAAAALDIGGGPPAVAASGTATVVARSAKASPWPVCTPQPTQGKAGNHDRYVFEGDDGRSGYRNAAGATVIAPRYYMAQEFSPAGVAAVIDEHGPAFIAPDGRLLGRALPRDNGPDSFVEGRARVVVHGRVGFIDLEGRLVVPPRYDFARAYCHGRAVVCQGCTKVKQGEHHSMAGGRWGLIDRSGRVVVPLRYDGFERWQGEHAVFRLGAERVGFDRDGGQVAPAGTAKDAP